MAEHFLIAFTRPEKPGEFPQGIYKAYKWNMRVLAANIRSGRLTPMLTFTPDSTETNKISCGICYNFFAKTNQTVCCSNHICTECIAACVTPPGTEQTCPFCRKPNFTVTPNLDVSQLKNPDGDDSQYVKFEKRLVTGFDSDDAEGCSDEAIAVALQFGWKAKEVDKQLKAGMSVQEVIQVFGEPGALESVPAPPPTPPPNARQDTPNASEVSKEIVGKPTVIKVSDDSD